VPDLLGAVLAGGESRRFGVDKARQVVAGLTLVERAARTLSAVFDEVVLVSSRGGLEGCSTIPDLRPGQGPLAGIEAALEHARQLGRRGAFVLACDLPLVTPATVWAVARACSDVDAAAPARDGVPSIEPLCAAYRTTCLEEVGALLERGERATHRLFETLAVTIVSRPAAEFLNVNTVEDACRATSALGEGLS
jgi:molybdopterin-guanine dinucleotide biosynthesis protein A